MPKPERLTAHDKRVGERMKARRLQLRLSLDAVGAALGVSLQQAQKYEKGKNSISPARMVALSKVLDCSVDYLLGTDRKRNAPKITAMVAELTSRTKGEKRTAIALIVFALMVTFSAVCVFCPEDRLHSSFLHLKP